eukprot:PITA_34042
MWMEEMMKVVKELEAQMLELKEAKERLAKLEVRYDKSKITVAEKTREVKALENKGVHVDLPKFQFIRDCPSSATLTELHNFLGLANFYRRFVLGFSHITWTLSQFTKGGAKEKFFWSESQQKAFTELKDRLYLALVLTLPYLQQPFEVETNASNYAIGVVLTQHGHPVAYHSEKLLDTVWKYPTYDKEMYSIMQACRQWKNYILGKETIIHTVH